MSYLRPKKPLQNYIDPEDKCQGVYNVTKMPGIYINETDCVDADRFDDIKQLFDIPRGKRVTGELYNGGKGGAIAVLSNAMHFKAK